MTVLLISNIDIPTYTGFLNNNVAFFHVNSHQIFIENLVTIVCRFCCQFLRFCNISYQFNIDSLP